MPKRHSAAGRAQGPGRARQGKREHEQAPGDTLRCITIRGTLCVCIPCVYFRYTVPCTGPYDMAPQCTAPVWTTPLYCLIRFFVGHAMTPCINFVEDIRQPGLRSPTDPLRLYRSMVQVQREAFVVSGSEDSQIYVWHRHNATLLEVCIDSILPLRERIVMVHGSM